MSCLVEYVGVEHACGETLMRTAPRPCLRNSRPPAMAWVVICTIGCSVVLTYLPSEATQTFSHNANSCEECHNSPVKYGSSPITIERIGVISEGIFISEEEARIQHSHRPAIEQRVNAVSGTRVSLSLIGDG